MSSHNFPQTYRIEWSKAQMKVIDPVSILKYKCIDTLIRTWVIDVWLEEKLGKSIN